MQYSGIGVIDLQHDELLKSIHLAVDAARNHAEPSVVLNLLYRVERYAEVHLKTEEALMAKYNYFDYPSHKAVHSDFLQVIHNALEKVRSTGRVDESALVFMERWLIDHIDVEAELFRHYLRP